MATQDQRSMNFKSPLPADELLFQRFSGTEQLGRLFEYQVDLLSENANIDPNDLLGRNVAVSLVLQDDSKREFNGIVSRFSHEGPAGGKTRYRITMRPWTWLLTRIADCRIFQEKTVPEIIKEVCKDRGFSDLEDRLERSYRKWPYCVQYRETDFNFLSRLMEQEGIYFYFVHAGGKHKLVLADATGSHRKASPDEKIPFFPPEPSDRRDTDHIFELAQSLAVQPGVYSLEEFDFTKPKADLSVKATNKRKHAHGGHEIYDYPGEYKESNDGKQYADNRIQELQAQHDRTEMAGNARGLACGDLFTLTESGSVHHGTNVEYLIIGASYEFSTNAFESGGGSDESHYVQLDCTEGKTPFRTPRTTPKPVVQGPQTAIVVGKSGEEIWTDKYGRVKVQFHWDRQGKKDENSSCWVRVAQVWAGKNWGAMHIPRIGQEVIVDFLEGDPDQPIIVGRVYNEDQMPPYTLPDNQTQSGIKSRSTKQGGPDHFNEIRFEDKKDAEEIYIHAERNFTRIVENDDVLKVGLEDKDKGDQTIEIHNNQKVTIGNGEADDGSQTVDIYKDRKTTLETGDDALTLKKGKRDVTLDKGNLTTKLSMGDEKRSLAKGKRTTDIFGNDQLTLKTGNYTMKVSAGKTTIQAMQSIELKCGPSSIKLDPSGVTIKGVMLKAQGTAMAELKAPMTTVDGSGMLTLKGGIVMIN